MMSTRIFSPDDILSEKYMSDNESLTDESDYVPSDDDQSDESSHEEADEGDKQLNLQLLTPVAILWSKVCMIHLMCLETLVVMNGSKWPRNSEAQKADRIKTSVSTARLNRAKLCDTWRINILIKSGSKNS